MVEQRSYITLFSMLQDTIVLIAHMYLFDFGTNGLMPVTDIPHVADYFTVDQEDKIAKAIRKIHDIISERKDY